MSNYNTRLTAGHMDLWEHLEFLLYNIDLLYWGFDLFVGAMQGLTTLPLCIRGTYVPEALGYSPPVLPSPG